MNKNNYLQTVVLYKVVIHVDNSPEQERDCRGWGSGGIEAPVVVLVFDLEVPELEQLAQLTPLYALRQVCPYPLHHLGIAERTALEI